jgi:hypothetical protein
VIWTSPGGAYIASHDSLDVAPGDSVWFKSHGKPIAVGIVARTHEDGWAKIDLSMGSLADARLDRVSVEIVHPLLRPMAGLRIGFPSAKRIGSYFACRAIGIRPPGPPGLFVEYRFDSKTVMQRVSEENGGALWPESISPLAFDERSDEEIALERGDLDVALFSPGELSSLLRSDPRWAGSPSGHLARGIFALTWNPAASDSNLVLDNALAILTALNRDLFRDDLQLLPPVQARLSMSTVERPIKIDVDTSCPGRAELQRYVDHLPRGKFEASIHARLVYLDIPVAPYNSLDQRLAAAAHSGMGSASTAATGTRIVPVFAVRCLAVCAPELRRYIRALSPDSLVNMIDCKP